MEATDCSTKFIPKTRVILYTTMFSKIQLVSLTLYAVLIAQVQAHGTITAITGANGVNGQGFGIIASTPRNGATPVPFEQDTSIIRNLEIKSGKTGVCGRTKAGGNNNVEEQLTAASQSGLPSAAADGSITMTLHQVNQDGAGPYSCDVSGDGGATFTDAEVTKNVPGFLSLSGATATDFPLVAKMPAGMACTAGPNGDACIVRCRNAAIAGPFGSCVAVTNSNSASNATVADVTSASSTSSAAQESGTDVSDSDDQESDADAADAGSGAGAKGAKGAAGGILGKLGLKKEKKRYISSRVIGKRSEKWLHA
ncbi:gEgh 16 [Pyrrhoderma noxium]|uniref:GEgh 16 n=1 Tax=Pyrrhoderma noxium TaxID=2282107 RepID=A0A286UE88_9AGAM|nr:gEgh 16 [Pyrrhoderma noxium]